jgi:dihydrofolate reductase
MNVYLCVKIINVHLHTEADMSRAKTAKTKTAGPSRPGAPAPGGSGRRVRYAVAASLDGYIAGPAGESDWIVMDPDIDFGALMREFDTLVMGRKTYEVARGRGPGGSMPGVEAFVFSRTLRQQDCRGVTVSSDPAATLRALKQKPGKDIWLFGGGGLFRSLLELGLVDTVEVGVMPVLLGSGLPLLPGAYRPAKLKLVGQRTYAKTGIVGLEYAVA